MTKGFQHFLKHWFHCNSGKRLFEQEKNLLDEALKNLFGYFAVQLGCVSQENLFANSRIQDKVMIDESVAHETAKKEQVHWVQAETDFLPIGRSAVDVVLLPHTLEAVDDPYYLLRQVDNMLRPEGHIVLSGFNPWGCLSFRMKHLSGSKDFKQAHFRRASRIGEWLEVLGYEVTSVRYTSVMCFNAYQKYPKWVKAIEFVERALCRIGLNFGNSYCLVAKKRVDMPTLVGLKWQLPSWRGLKSGAPLSSKNWHNRDKEKNRR
ncbi:class I SAM-dependent methyltransferase [Thiomicrorhabdus sediminis]|uniref:Methyltransferase domain-containing protein n=1 Tax=Thiomicrorhabdus sediminis TaxID=2580412 RepID=A0A4P9K677_9GAMM|nr:methyltransferase domain-containing protein [Thiomicrorhabdus sediminis]QCU90368.1 methyltransferase domain-containing protein [Thiomicrorhabdus sediminis]